MRIQPVQQIACNRPSLKQNNIAFSGTLLQTSMKDAVRLTNLKDWLQLFEKLQNAAKNDKGFVGNEYFINLEACMSKPTVSNICNAIKSLCNKHFKVGYIGREPIGRDNAGVSVMLCRDEDHAGFIRFVSSGKCMDFGVTNPIGGKEYQFFREPYLDVEFHNEQYGGTIRKASDMSTTKYYNPDGSRDYGRGIRDLFASLM